jgi:hypothetical protein
MKYLLVLLAFVSLPVFGQTHVTQPFHYFWDEDNTAIVNHYQIKIDGGAPQNVAIPVGVPSTVAGNTTFSVLASPTLALGNHTLVVGACTTADLTVGCADSLPLAFVLDPKAPPAPVNLKVGP